MKKTIISVIVLLNFMLVFSYGLINTEELTGDIVTPLTAISGGTGNTVFTSDPVINPSLRKSGDTYYIQLAFLGMHYRETRTQYVFDSYDNNIGEKTVYDNSYFYGEPTLISAYIPLSSFGVYLGYQNLYSKDYDYEKIMRDDYYVTLFSEQYSSNGNVNAYFISVSYEWNNLTVGGNFSIMQGDANADYAIVYVDPSMQDSAMTVTEKYSGLKGGFALSYKYRDLEATAFYHIPTVLSVERSIAYEAADTAILANELDGFIPTMFGMGIMYTPANIRPVTLTGEAIYEAWSQLNGNSTNYYDLIKYHIGIRHKMSRDFTMMYGIFYEPFRQDNQIVDIGFSMGASYEINNIEFMLSSQYVQNQYYEEPEDDAGEPGVNFTNRYIKLNADVGITF